MAADTISSKQADSDLLRLLAANMPADERLAFAHWLLGTLIDRPQSVNRPVVAVAAEPPDRGAALRWVRSRPDDGLPPPTDDEVAQWLDEHRVAKYGR